MGIHVFSRCSQSLIRNSKNLRRLARRPYATTMAMIPTLCRQSMTFWTLTATTNLS